MKTRVAARIVGRVQGVGFRPTVYRYATEMGLSGFVRNDSQGVTLEVEGEDQVITRFFRQLTLRPPQQAVIADIKTQVLPAKGEVEFRVEESRATGDTAVEIAPDLALCEDCRRELFDGRDRRHDYAFINCTNCGPRFTIIRDVPYDRERTSMADFRMCPACAHEYAEPASRRFDAQPNACPRCGPQLELLVAGGNPDPAHVIPHTQELLRRGRIVAIKSLGGYQLACDALSAECVARLRQRKHRPHKAFAVMFRDLATLRRHCVASEAEEAELLTAAAPIVVLRRAAGTALAPNIAPDTTTVGAFLPYSPLHHLLMETFDALVMTSGNLTDEPIVCDEAELSTLLGPLADAALTHDRDIVHRCDDSVVRVSQGQRQFLRRARGFVPSPIRIASASPVVLAVGGELKNTFCVVRGGNAFVSQHIGDLKDFRTLDFYRREIEEWQRLLHVTPVAIAHDLHPDYLSTKYAQQQVSPLPVGVQHHHAHIVSVMAEHELHEPVIGVALDGTGYGTDGTIWGGEFMVADRTDLERVAHFKAYPLPGGDKAVTEPWRMATSVLLAEHLPTHHRHAPLIEQMIATGFNTPLTTSAGRLFDAVAALLGLGDEVTYEAQAAIRLEAIADTSVTAAYEFRVITHERPWVVDFGPAIQTLVAEKKSQVPIREIAAKFHNTVAAAVVQICRYVRGQRSLNTVALSGGVFQNEFLLRRVVEQLQARHFQVFTNTAVPTNDGGLALGQAAVAVARWEGSASCV